MLDLDVAITSLVAHVRRAHDDGFKLIFIGVGGDAGSASHMAIDFSKNGNVRALSFDAAAAVTCLGNDLGFERIFAKQIELPGRAGDIAIVLGGGGTDLTVLNAARAARQAGLKVITTSASLDENPLSALGDLNFRIPIAGSGIARGRQFLRGSRLGGRGPSTGLAGSKFSSVIKANGSHLRNLSESLRSYQITRNFTVVIVAAREPNLAATYP